MAKPFIFVGLVGHCVILAEIQGIDDFSNEEIPSFFAAFMQTKDGKPGCCLGETATLHRITHNRNVFSDVVPFCQGYNLAVQERRNCLIPGESLAWAFKREFSPDKVEIVSNERMAILRAWPCTGMIRS